MATVSPSRRKDMDIMKLMMSNHEVEMIEDCGRVRFHVMWPGPTETPYEGGIWKVSVELPDEYPYKSPSIGFLNKMFHPNVDQTSGTVCLDVINQTWSPMYNLVNIFDVFLPQLMRYPNPSDPLNTEAASLLLRSSDKFNERVKSLIRKNALQQEEERQQQEAGEGLSSLSSSLNSPGFANPSSSFSSSLSSSSSSSSSSPSTSPALGIDSNGFPKSSSSSQRPVQFSSGLPPQTTVRLHNGFGSRSDDDMLGNVDDHSNDDYVNDDEDVEDEEEEEDLAADMEL